MPDIVMPKNPHEYELVGEDVSLGEVYYCLKCCAFKVDKGGSVTETHGPCRARNKTDRMFMPRRPCGGGGPAGKSPMWSILEDLHLISKSVMLLRARVLAELRERDQTVSLEDRG